jgi:hypothetical protein
VYSSQSVFCSLKALEISPLLPEDQDRLSTPKKSGNRVKYTCPSCGANAWGKVGLHLICADCDQSMTGDTLEEREEDG